MSQYFNWTATGMRFAAERQPHGPMQYVRADEHDKLKHEVERLRLVAERHTGYEPDCADCPDKAGCHAAGRCNMMASRTSTRHRT